MKIKCLLLTALLLAVGSIGFAQSTTKEIAPETVVGNLYAAQKTPQTAPFFQTKNRALIDRYFDAPFIGDLIWTNAVAAGGKGNAGAINFNPLFGSQNPQTIAYTISRMKNLGDSNNAWVYVKFKNAGKAEEAHFELQRDAAKKWKIRNIYYTDRADLATLLRYSQDAAFRAEYDKNTFYKGDFLVGTVKCTFTPIDPLKFRVQCADRNDYQIYTDQGNGVYADYIEKDGNFIKQGEFIFTQFTPATTTGKFVDASGKTVEVTRIKANNSITVTGAPNSIERSYTGAGELEIGEGESLISQFDEQATDYAAYCFTNKSMVGRAILAMCKNGHQCQFTGTIEPGKCKTPDNLKAPSSSRRINEIALVKFVPTNPITAKKGTIERLAQTLAAAFESGTMGSLDAEKPYLNRVEVVFEDSLSDDRTSKTHKTLKAVEQSFRGKDDDSNFFSHIFQSCANGVCTFDGGVVHNTLFLHKITYTVVKGRPYIKAVHFIGG